MTGTAIVAALLARHEPLTVLVPAARMKAGRLPDGVDLPAILIRTVSIVERQPLKQGAWVRYTARISVMVRAASYRDQGAIIRLVRRAGAGFTGDLAGCRRIAVLTAGVGPDVNGPGNSFEQTQDFRVSFDGPA